MFEGERERESFVKLRTRRMQTCDILTNFESQGGIRSFVYSGCVYSVYLKLERVYFRAKLHYHCTQIDVQIAQPVKEVRKRTVERKFLNFPN